MDEKRICCLEKHLYYNSFLIDYNRFVFIFVDTDEETQL